MNEKLVFEEGRWSYHEGLGQFNILAESVRKLSNARMFFRNIFIEPCSTDRKMMIETIIEVEGVVFIRIESIYINDWFNYENFDNFRASLSRSKDSNTRLAHRVAFGE